MKKKIFFERILLLVFMLCIPLTHVHGQTDRQVNVVLQNASISQVFSEIKKQTQVNFIYSNEDVKKLPSKNYDMHRSSVAQVMQYALSGSDLSFEIVNNTVVIKHKKTQSITGKITDSNGEPLPGVAVQVKETGKGNTTDINGHFSIPAENMKDAHLHISFLGMKDKTVHWTGKSLNIVMEDEVQNIDDVVVTGYQVINKRALTSAVNTIKAEDIIRPDVNSIDQMLEGQVPDMIFMTNSGETSATPRIRIRGTSSIIGNREPLWVVDGIVVNDPVEISVDDLNDPDYVNRIGNAIAGLNPQDIERLDILKDASATALYGTRAANGVIVITTKRGREGKAEIRYTNNFTFKIRPRYTDHSVDVMNSKERMQFSRDLFESRYLYNDNISMVGYEGLLNDLYNGRINDHQFLEKVSELETINTDWFDLLAHDSFSQQHTISMSGGSKDSRYYASIGYTDGDDVVKGTTNKRYTAMLNLDNNFTNWLSASFGLQGNVSKRSYYQDKLSPVDYAYTASRTIPAFDSNGEYYYYKKVYESAESYNYNIMNELNNSGVTQDGSSITLNANFKFKFNDWLSANAIGSYTYQNTDIESYWGDKTYYAACLRKSEYGVAPPEDSAMPQGGELSSSHSRQDSYTIRLQLDWNKFFGADEKHNFNGSLGYEMSSTNYVGNSYIARGYYPDRGLSFPTDIDISKYPNYGGWLAQNVPNLRNDLSHILSGYASFTYSYDRMLYLNLNGRIDGSNRFGDQSNKKLLPIWSASASFNFSQLPFMKEIEWIDYLTVKTSYGFQGNMLSDVSPVLIIRKGSMSDFYNEFVSHKERNPNPELKWERTNSYNFGIEISLFNSRVQLEGSVYLKRTKDAFMSKTISTVNGVSSYIVNGGNISNDGYSIDVTLNPIMKKNWQWSLTTSFSRVLNEITTSPDGEEYLLQNFLNGTAVVKGKPIGTFYSYKFLGLSPVDGGPMFDDYEDHYEDLVGLSKYDTYTTVLEASGTREPYMQGGLSTRLRYKNLRFHAQFTYSLGAKTRRFGMFGEGAISAGDATLTNAGDIRPEWNASRDYLDRWIHPGDEAHTIIPAIIGPTSSSYYNYLNHWSSALNDEGVQTIANSYWDMYDYSNIRVVSADYLKCTSMSLTYTFPDKLVKNWSLKRLELTLTANNLFTICDSRLKGQTPVQGGFTTIQLSERPSFSFGLNVTF